MSLDRHFGYLEEIELAIHTQELLPTGLQILSFKEPKYIWYQRSFLFKFFKLNQLAENYYKLLDGMKEASVVLIIKHGMPLRD